MKHLLVSILAIFAVLCAGAQELKYTEASDLTLAGKMFDTPNPYHRVDTVEYNQFVPIENLLMRMSTGLSVFFKTDSPSITMKCEYGFDGVTENITCICSMGYDLYIKKDGKWLWAASASPDHNDTSKPFTLVEGMDSGEKECLLYLPIFAELYSVKLGIPERYTIEALENPMKGRVLIHGSSFTHGASASRAGMTYPAQFSRNNGINLLSAACSGSAIMQSYFADMFCDIDADAYIFDTFSNPSETGIKERLFPFIEKLQAAHPGKPLIFQQTIYRECRNFNMDADWKEAAKSAMADSLMKIACKKYKDVYYIKASATGKDHETSVDGTHPNDYGHSLWAKSIEKPIMKILRKYGIK